MTQLSSKLTKAKKLESILFGCGILLLLYSPVYELIRYYANPQYAAIRFNTMLFGWVFLVILLCWAGYVFAYALRLKSLFYDEFGGCFILGDISSGKKVELKDVVSYKRSYFFLTSFLTLSIRYFFGPKHILFKYRENGELKWAAVLNPTSVDLTKEIYDKRKYVLDRETQLENSKK